MHHRTDSGLLVFALLLVSGSFGQARLIPWVWGRWRVGSGCLVLARCLVTLGCAVGCRRTISTPQEERGGLGELLEPREESLQEKGCVKK